MDKYARERCALKKVALDKIAGEMGSESSSVAWNKVAGEKG